MFRRIAALFIALTLLISIPASFAQGDAPSGTLRYAVNVTLTSMNPWFEAAPAFFAAYHIPYEGLLIEADDGTIVGQLADSWEYNDDQTVLTLNIIDGVVFHDGTEFNAEVAAATLNHLKNNIEYPPTNVKMAAFESAEATDANTLVITLSRPDIAFIDHLARNAGIMMSPDTWDSDWPAGTGPWQIVPEESTIDGTIVFERFEGYRDPSVQGVERIEYLQIPDQNARLNGLQSGDLDVIAVPSALADAAAEAGAVLYNAPSVIFGLQVVDLNGEVVPELADKDFRCAISQAIDRDAIANVLNHGYSEPMTQLRLEGGYGYIEDAPDTGFNPEAAGAILSQHEGVEMTTGSWGPFNVVANATAGALAEYGITLNVEQINSSQMWPSVSQAVYPIATIPYPESNIITELQNRGVAGPRNPSGYVPEGVAELLAEAEMLPAEEAEPLLAEAHRIMIEECIWIPVFVDLGTVAANENVTGLARRTNIPVAINVRGVRVDG